MRKGILIAGLVVLAIGIGALAGGFVIVLGQVGPGTGAFTSQLTTTTLAPGASVSLGTPQQGKVAIIEYTDNISSAIQVTAGSANIILRTVSNNGVTTYIAVVTAAGSSQPIALSNDQATPVAVHYAMVQSDLATLADGGLLILGGGGALIVGIILVIVGAVMKKKVRPGQEPASQSP